MIFIVILLFLITGCSDMDLPELPDNESVIDDAVVLDPPLVITTSLAPAVPGGVVAVI